MERSQDTLPADEAHTEDTPKFTIFHYRDGQEPTESGAMEVVPGDPGHMPMVEQCIEAGMMEGAENRIVFRGFGMSILHIWFKQNYPLPRHSHDKDCAYYVIAGSLRLGTEELSAGDGFFIPANVPYAYTAGPDGVELIEFRSAESFDYRDLTGKAFWERALRLTKENHEAWRNARRPSGVVLE